MRGHEFAGRFVRENQPLDPLAKFVIPWAGFLNEALAFPCGKSQRVAEDLRLAWRSLGRITGRVDVEDLLDVVFADFCIGK